MGGVLRAKLAIGKINDPLEHEADRVADQVMRLPDLELSVTPARDQVNRKCEACEDEERRQLQTKPAGGPVTAGGEAPDNVQKALRSSGQPLDASARAFFEPRFGRDFSQVRVHADGEAAQTNRQLGAQAFTHGPHIFYAAGKAPAKDVLTGHELTHVVQQGAAPALRNATEVAPIAARGVRTGTAQLIIQRLPGDGMVPPGDCTWSKYVLLRASVETAKAVVQMIGGCKPGDSCQFTALKIAAVMAEIAARVALVSACYRGGDTGHVEQIQAKINMYNRCVQLFQNSNCPPELIKAMEAVVQTARVVIAAASAVVAVAAIIALVMAIIALVEAIAALVAAAAEAAAIAAAAAGLTALLVALKGQLAPDKPADAPTN
jgi:hypothetical protein